MNEDQSAGEREEEQSGPTGEEEQAWLKEAAAVAAAAAAAAAAEAAAAEAAEEAEADEWEQAARLASAGPAAEPSAEPAADSAAGPPSGPYPGQAPAIELLMDVELEATLRFGSREMTLGEVLELGPGDVIELDRQVNDAVDLLIGDKIVARGVAVLSNGHYGLRVTEVAALKLGLESVRCLF